MLTRRDGKKSRSLGEKIRGDANRPRLGIPCSWSRKRRAQAPSINIRHPLVPQRGWLLHAMQQTESYLHCWVYWCACDLKVKCIFYKWVSQNTVKWDTRQWQVSQWSPGKDKVEGKSNRQTYNHKLHYHRREESWYLSSSLIAQYQTFAGVTSSLRFTPFSWRWISFRASPAPRRGPADSWDSGMLSFPSGSSPLWSTVAASVYKLHCSTITSIRSN